MNSLQKIIRLAVFALAILALAVGSASAQTTRTLTVGTVSGTVGGADVLIPITISDAAGVGGVAFTLNYNPALFTFLGLEQAPTSGWTVRNPEDYAADPVTTGYPYYNPYKKEAPYADRIYTLAANATLFFQFNDVKDVSNNPVGRVLVSGASAEPLTGTVLFRAKFNIKSGGVNGTTYPIGIGRSIINNPAAGYTTDTMIPALVGAGDKVDGKYTTLNFPVIPATLVAGGITVSAPVFTLGGKVTYGSGANAVGCTVILQRETAAGYVFNSQTTVGNDGLYLFTGKDAGNYKLSVTSLDPNYNNYVSPSAIALTANKTNANVALELKPQPVRVTGTVTSGNIPGLLVKVVDPNGNVMGIYGVATDGTWSTP
ncbi:MAG: cohesin domain-containing protein, partial [Desulfobacterales bacterium]|nr:cohesin domain-containing protein [Desulfobacterales bacterium]